MSGLSNDRAQIGLKRCADFMESKGFAYEAMVIREALSLMLRDNPAPANTGLITMDMQAQSTIDAMRAREAAFND